jgi:hypothetical protein
MGQLNSRPHHSHSHQALPTLPPNPFLVAPPRRASRPWADRVSDGGAAGMVEVQKVNWAHKDPQGHLMNQIQRKHQKESKSRVSR